MKEPKIHVKLTDKSYNRLCYLAKRMGVPKSTVVRFALNHYYSIKGLNREGDIKNV